MNISFLILLLSISLSTQAGERQHAEITLETERDVAQIKEGERHSDIKDDSASFSPDQEKKSANALPEIDIISDINAQFEHTINKLQATEEVKPNIETADKRPSQVFINDNVTILTKNETSQAKNNSDHANNQTGTIQATSDNCVKEKVYSLDVDNAAQYKRLEDFPFTYECVIRR